MKTTIFAKKIKTKDGKVFYKTVHESNVFWKG